MSKFSFRRSEQKAFKHISHGLVPAATIAPRPAVPRTPPPRSPYPSPERSRSALSAAILSSSLIGQTVVIPPGRSRSFSESDCSEAQTTSAPYGRTTLYTRDTEPEFFSVRPPLPSPGCSEDDDDADVEREELSDEDCHVYQSLDRQGRSLTRDTEGLYARPVKLTGPVQSERAEETDDSAFDIVSPLHAEEDEVQQSAVTKTPSPKLKQSPVSSCHRTMPSPDVTEERLSVPGKRNKSSRRQRHGPSEASGAYREVLEVQKEMVRCLTEQNQALGADRRVLEQRCTEQSLQLQRSLERIQSLEQEVTRVPAPTEDKQTELLSRYQTRFRPLTKEESSKTLGLPPKGPAPPWLLDMKYLSPLLLAYEDHLSEKDALLQALQEDLQMFHVRVKEVVQENEKLLKERKQSGRASNKEWKQLQEQACLVLQENQVLIQQLEMQYSKAKDSHGRHLTEVSKLSKQLMLLEAEQQRLEAELGDSRRDLQSLRKEHVQACCRLENAVSWEEHHNLTTKLKFQLEADACRLRVELEELQQRVSCLQAEKKSLVLDKTNMAADIKALESSRCHLEQHLTPEI
ncbi:hypothetical protein UPYG_G00164300 [Umbra pygmaea]|uniref:Centrosomal protein of 89 kDa n=1 Tax=Umbra pygmaea TaxID=75934 RepID=A0ABD0XA27_UMBPY